MMDRQGHVRDFLELTKPRITLMVLLSSSVGYLLGTRGSVDPAGWLVAILGIALVAGGTSALNQVLERDVDAKMTRTRGRPIPAGRLGALPATVFSLALSLAGIGLLAVLVNGLTAGLAGIALVLYVGVYTPLKPLASFATVVGAIPGALPIVGGWTAASGELGAGAWALFGILFFWQLPHFLALAWLYRDDYRAGGLRMLTVTDPTGSQAGHQSVLYALALLPTSLLPAVLGLSGLTYAVAALGLTGAYLASAVRFARRTDGVAARRLFRTSLLYLPLLLIALAVDGGPVRGGGHASAQAAVAASLVP
ncbi:MAG: heme o synthase [Gemmatimonadota bacterium]